MKKGYNYSGEIVQKIRQSIKKINSRIRELKLNRERNIRKDVGKGVFLKLKDKQKQILTDMKNLRLRAIKYIPDDKLSQSATVSLLNLIGIIDVKIRLYKEDWKERERRKRIKR